MKKYNEDDVKKYNEGYINDFSFDIYEKYLQNPMKLEKLRKNNLKKYSENSTDFDGYLAALKESLDHYVLKQVLTNPLFIKSPEFENYLKYVVDSINYNNREIYSNVFMYTFFNNKILNERLNKHSININIEQKYNNYNNTLRYIYSKIINNVEISQNELNIICAQFSERKPEYHAYTNLIKYIYNNLTAKNSKLKCSLEVKNALLNYAPVFASKWCEKYKKIGFDPSNVRYFIVDQYNWYKTDTFGMSLSEYSQAIFSKQKMQKDFDLKTYKSLEATFDFFDCKESKNLQYDAASVMLIAFHELTHQYQRYLSKKSEYIEDGFMYVEKLLLDKYYQDYNVNHDNDDIEINATAIGWDIMRTFFMR